VVYFGIRQGSIGILVAVLLAIAGLRLLFGGRGTNIGTRIVALAMGVVALVTWLRGDTLGLLWYPVACNGIFFAVFAYSLRQPQTLIERLARLREPQLSAEGVAYTRKVTLVWCGFFLVNGSVAAITALVGDMQLWTLYNGMLSYLLMAALFAGEWLVRQRLRTS
jgi:uncharacterized membrane protein